MKPLISYYGGKQRMASKIVPLIPPHTVYVEPFAGGAAVFYKKPRPDGADSEKYKEVLNDLNNDLITLYLESRDDPIGIARVIDSIPFSATINRWSDMPQKDRRASAIAAYVGYNQSFAYKRGAGWRRTTLTGNDAFMWDRRGNNFRSAANRLRGVYLECCDVIKCISNWDSPQTFFYCDPPYFATHTGHMGSWSPEDQASLANTLNRSQGSWIVSGYDFSRSVLNYEQCLKFSANCSASGVGRVKSSRNHFEPGTTRHAGRIERLFIRGPSRPVRASLIPVLERQTCFTGPLLGPCPLPLKTHPSARR